MGDGLVNGSEGIKQAFAVYFYLYKIAASTLAANRSGWVLAVIAKLAALDGQSLFAACFPER